VDIAFVTAFGLRAGIERKPISTQTSFAEGHPESEALPEKRRLTYGLVDFTS
jgi:hypothetical protein